MHEHGKELGDVFFGERGFGQLQIGKREVLLVQSLPGDVVDFEYNALVAFDLEVKSILEGAVLVFLHGGNAGHGFAP